MPRHFTRAGTWRDPRHWLNAVERFNDRWSVKEGTRDAKIRDVVIIGCVALSTVFFSLAYFK